MNDPPLPTPPDSLAVKQRWSALDPLFGVFAAVVLLSILGTLVVGITGDEGLDTVLAAQASLEITLIAVAFGLAAARDLRPSAATALGFRRPVRGAWWEAGGIFLLYVVAVVSYGLIVGPPEQRDLADELGFNESTLGAVTAVLLIVVIAPFAEETFFRGFLFGSLRQTTSVWPAALVSGTLFGLVHFTTGEATVIPPLVLLGVLLAWLYARADSIWPCIGVHTVNNAIAVIPLVS